MNRQHPLLHIVILAAGAGTRMRSELPKVLHPIMGKPMLQWVIDAAKPLQPQSIWIVTGDHSQIIQSTIQDPSIHWVQQNPILGTGDALQQLYPHLAAQVSEQDNILILCADSPMISVSSLAQLIQASTQHPIVLLNLILANPTGFGRIIRNEQNHITHIVEEKDADNQQKAIQEIYSGIMLVKFYVLTKLLPLLTNENNQKEYYQVQLIELGYHNHFSIGSVITKDDCAARGVNDRAQLAALEREMQQQQAIKLMQQGVSIVDPARFDLRGTLQAEPDVRIDINCIIEGEVSIQRGTTIGAHCILKNCQLGKHVTIQPYTMIDGATIANHAIVGPFARIRPGTVLEESVQIGNFVEVKKTKIGKSSKANHLSYLGDANIGSQVNIGAGTITCNYDGNHKHETHIEDEAFIGSNTALVAPISIGRETVIGAGSVIAKNVPANHLGLTRSEQKNINWRKKASKHSEISVD